jgi:molybdate transport system permease protein
VGFAACLGEFGAVITFAANVPGQTQTLPLAIYSAIQSPGGEVTAARLAAVSLAIALAALVAAELLARRARRWTGR